MLGNIAKITIGDFEKQPDGSWVVAKTSDIQTDTGDIIRLQPGMVLKKGGKLCGFDIVKILDEMSQN